MKVTHEHAARNRDRVIASAARLFRERGFDGIGVDALMRAAGLTHGGFYGHFRGKQELIAEAAAKALAVSAQTWEEVAAGAPDAAAIDALASHYLSARHRDSAGTGCLFAALGGELPRHGPALKRAATAGLKPFVDLLSGLVPGRSAAVRRRKALAAYAAMIGGMVLARAVDDAALSEEILAAVAHSLPGATTRHAPAPQAGS